MKRTATASMVILRVNFVLGLARKGIARVARTKGFEVNFRVRY